MVQEPHHTHAVIATDTVIFTVQNGELLALFIKMKKRPFTNRWAFPGGLIKSDEDLPSAARRILREKTGVVPAYLSQLGAFGRVDRDPFGRVVSVAYFALIPNDRLALATSSEYGGIAWIEVKKAKHLAYDHSEMLAVARSELQRQIQNTTIASSLLPSEFTLTELQRVHEAILGHALDKRNFRKRLLMSGLVKPTHKKRKGLPQPPAVLYQFIKAKPKASRSL
jgi:8-oxo-dGTP diphosphatase